MALVPTVMSEVCQVTEFCWGLDVLLEAFYNTILLYGYDLQLVDFRNVDKQLVHLLYMCVNAEGAEVCIETVGVVDHCYQKALEVIGYAMWKTIEEA